ncbi:MULTISPECIES: branched-chain amino acid ABC transporter permease [unclassified Bradyrhizobium]|uniref:branched-chain amino acid ABC transporter permease n=1 Tax=unclassified Bradyrhizobium TaxID=2631580 RepID=UPI00247A09B0|nr:MULTISPECIES: branched-chain amino acid ABC transporter permease [unclassified Bradyrhizobium]WGS23275.1 branched-chain amino acid ABC transporter permease [Bradyrhizobium sp. ISRA463]WGS30282.1 branched-chain amino acid ABC transporter permease [Bradyrhizobium sp. ISRA464]
MPTLPQFLSQAFNGIALGSLLALIACGLTIILGTLGVLNFAHGAMFMFGAYVAFIVLGHLDSFAAALVLGALSLLAFGFALERGLIRLYYDRPHEDQILVTFGLAIMMIEAVHYVFGGESQRVPVPSWGQGIVNLHFFYYPLYRVEAIGIAGLILLGFYLLLYRTRIGLVVRAGIEDPLMVELLGTHVRRAFMAVFSIGAMAAGIAGVIYAPLAAIIPNMGEQFLVQCFVVVVIGGLGSFPGAIVGGLVVGEILSLTTLFNPAYAQAAIYAVMTLVLIVRPRGLFGTMGRA